MLATCALISSALGWVHISYGIAEGPKASEFLLTSLHPAMYGFKTEDMVGVFSIEKKVILAAGSCGEGGSDISEPNASDVRLGPRVLGLSVDPQVLNTSSNEPLNLSLRLSENATIPPVIRLVSPSGGMSAEAVLNAELSSTLGANDTIGVNYSGSISLSDDVEPGRWRIASLIAYDSEGHKILLGEDELRAMGFPTYVEVLSRGRSPFHS